MAEDDTFIKSAVILNQHTRQNNPDTGRQAWSVFFPPGKEKKTVKLEGRPLEKKKELGERGGQWLSTCGSRPL